MQITKVKKDDVFDYLEEYKNVNTKPLEEFLLDLTMQDPFNGYKFYIFSFLKHNMKGMMEKTLYHQPRLTKPEPTDSSMLFRVDPKKAGDVEVIWILPNLEAIEMFQKGKLFEDQVVNESIREYIDNPERMRKPANDDPSDYLIKELYKGMKKGTT